MRQLWFIVPLIVILGGVGWLAIYEWNAVEGPPMPGWGYAAIFGGVFFSLLVGCGLMALLFYSNRHGYDDIGDNTRRRD